jgi:hypothetical protein
MNKLAVGTAVPAGEAALMIAATAQATPGEAATSTVLSGTESR